MNKRITTTAGLCALVCALLAACTKSEPPVYITSDMPPIPQTCKDSGPREPKLRVGQDADDIDAANDRINLKNWGRTHVRLRQACLQELQTVLPRG